MYLQCSDVIVTSYLIMRNKKIGFYIAQYPILRFAQRSLQFTFWQTCSTEHHLHLCYGRLTLRRVCGVWCVVCGVWCVVCGVWCVVCGVWCVVCGVCGECVVSVTRYPLTCHNCF